MNYQTLDASLYHSLLLAGFTNLKNNVTEVNDLNVFPIPDGDTGDNMLATIGGGVHLMEDIKNSSLGEITKKVSDGMLLSARGNSGVILSQMFDGIAKGFENVEISDVETLANAMKLGVQYAYQSVETPVEGTMLTVMKDASDFAFTHVNGSSDVLSYFNDFVSEAHHALQRTPELLDVLKNAGVIDSGGAGIVYIFEGFVKALKGEEVPHLESEKTETKTIDFSKFNENTVMKFGYCTEFLLQLQHAKIDIKNFKLEEIISYLKTKGDSIVALLNGTVVKVHVHTMNPGEILDHCLKYGEYLTVKIENMTLQHNETIKENKKPKYKKNPVRKKMGVVVVLNGDGLKAMFSQLGVDVVIDGGQGMNPAVEDFFEAYDAVNADEIIVFPNNSNVIMAAQKSKEVYKKSNVHVMESKNVGQAYVALTGADINPDDVDQLCQDFEYLVKHSKVGLVSKAIRDSNIDQREIHIGDYVGMVNKKILVNDIDEFKTGLSLIDQLTDDRDEFIICLAGKNVSHEDREKFDSLVKDRYPSLEYYRVDGEQDIYDFILVIQ